MRDLRTIYNTINDLHDEIADNIYGENADNLIQHWTQHGNESLEKLCKCMIREHLNNELLDRYSSNLYMILSLSDLTKLLFEAVVDELHARNLIK